VFTGFIIMRLPERVEGALLMPKDKRQTAEQADAFANKAMQGIPSGDPYRKIMRWLVPRTGRV
jgi:hypothetical protein